MNPHLTKKATPSGLVKAAEGLLGILLCLAAGMLGFSLVYGVVTMGIQVGTLLGFAVLIAIPVAVLCWLTERMRARVHARVITSALCMSEKGSVPFEELMKVTRINRLELVIAKLSCKGYIRNVAVIGSDVCLTDRVAETAEN